MPVTVPVASPVVRAHSAWWFPDLALAAAAVTLFYCLFLFQGYQNLFRDSDAGWHLRNGEAILASHHLPVADPYSFSFPGRPWFAWEWGADVVTGAIHRSAGLRGVALFYGTAIAVGVWLWFRLHWAMGGNFLLACGMAPLLLSTCNIHWLARPHVLSWLFLLAAIWWLERGRGWLGFGILTLVWANVHGSFVLAPVLAGVYALFAPAESRPQPRLAAPLCALAAGLVNPYGWRLYQHVFAYLTNSDLLGRIGEFQSFDFHAAGAGQIIVTLIVAIASGTLALTQGRVHHFLIAIGLSILALRSARALPLVALAALPIANAAIVAAWPQARKVWEYGDRLRKLDARMSGLLWAPVAVLAAYSLLRLLPAGFPPDQFPVAAYAHIPADARLFAPDKFGGYLIYRSNGARKVFFDGRSDFYGAEFLKQYGRLVQVRPGWRQYWEGWQFTHALLPNDAPLLAALEQLGWREIYRDGTVTLLAGRGT